MASVQLQQVQKSYDGQHQVIHGIDLEIRDGDAMVYWFASGMAEAQLGLRIPVAGSLSGLCVEQAAILVCEDSETDPRVDRDACRRTGVRAAAAFSATRPRTGGAGRSRAAVGALQ